jgi:RNA polymerase sigma factor (sigma-70 family)
MTSIDAPSRVGNIGDNVARDPVDAAYERCRAKLGGLGVSAPAFRKELLEALADEPIEELEKRIKVEDMYLALGCLMGSDKGWRTFDQAYRGYLLRLATRYAGGREAAEDLITDLYSDLVTRKNKPGKLHQYKGYASLATWLAVIVRRMAMDRGRMRERRGARLRRLKADGNATQVRRNPERDYAAAQTAAFAGELFAEAFSNLNERHVLVLTLLYRDEMTLREAGRVMELDFSTVSRRAKAARTALQERMTTLAKERHGLEDGAVADLFIDGAGGASFASVGEVEAG